MLNLLTVKNISKRFGGLTVLDKISFELNAGQVLGLAGRSGAGKSSLLRVLAGITKPDSGEIYWKGETLPPKVSAVASEIGYVGSEPVLAENSDITGNIFLGQELSWRLLGGLVEMPLQKRMVAQASAQLARLDWPFNTLSMPISSLTSEQKQLISIARLMVAPRQMILVDDPNQLLGLPLQKRLLALIQEWQQADIAVVLASNELDHLFAVTDYILVLNQGASAGLYRTDVTSREEIVAALAGRGSQREFSTTVWALDHYYQARQQAEALQHQQVLLQRDLATQGSLNRQLLNQLSEQVSTLDRVNLALQEAQRRLLVERELERKSLSRELHDELIQDLLGLVYRLDDLETTTEPQKLSNLVEDLQSDVRQMVVDLRQICGNLRPPTIDSLGLGSALQSFTNEWQKHTGIAVQLQLAPHLTRLPEDTELAIFRIVQEALSNVRKHADASGVQVVLEPTSPRMLRLTIRDNGRGLGEFDIQQVSRSGHFGLLGISERVALLGGRLKLGNQAEGGAFLEIEVPHPRETRKR
jgi:signal transduction histidine kinase